MVVQVDLRHQDADIRSKEYEKSRYQSARKNEHVDDIVELGIDLKEFYKSVEWDILGVPAQRSTVHTSSSCHELQFLFTGTSSSTPAVTNPTWTSPSTSP